MNKSDPCDAQLAELLTLTVSADCNGTTIYRNQSEQVHRVLGPAVIFSDGDEWWYLNGKRFSEWQHHERIKSL